jgi:carbamate kinase
MRDVLIVVALGGNALLRRGDALEAEVQRHNVRCAAAVIADLARAHDVVVTHGNGPQIGLLALQSDAYQPVRTYPLDVLGAESEGMVGYLLDQEIGNALRDGPPVATILTQVVVDANDPAFAHPTKPIGPLYTRDEAAALAAERGWTVAPDGAGARWRRVVPSPAPHAIVELEVITSLRAAGILVICLGGGGIPVVVDDRGARRGVEAVVDKDAAAGLLARTIGADRLLLLTDVPAVELDHGTARARRLGRVPVGELARYEFAPGSMGPKVDAACGFVRATGNIAVIGALEDGRAMACGRAGTVVVPDGCS